MSRTSISIDEIKTIWIVVLVIALVISNLVNCLITTTVNNGRWQREAVAKGHAFYYDSTTGTRWAWTAEPCTKSVRVE